MSTNEYGNITEFSIDIDVSGVMAATGNSCPTGYWKSRVTDAYMKPENDKRVILRVQIAEGPGAGATRTAAVNIPTSKDDKSIYYTRAAFESLGLDTKALDKGMVTINRSTFVGKTAHIFYQTPEDAGNEYGNVEFYPPAVWAARKSAHEAQQTRQIGAAAPTNVKGSESSSNGLGDLESLLA